MAWCACACWTAQCYSSSSSSSKVLHMFKQNIPHCSRRQGIRWLITWWAFLFLEDLCQFNSSVRIMSLCVSNWGAGAVWLARKLYIGVSDGVSICICREGLHFSLHVLRARLEDFLRSGIVVLHCCLPCDVMSRHGSIFLATYAYWSEPLWQHFCNDASRHSVVFYLCTAWPDCEQWDFGGIEALVGLRQ